MSEKDHYFNKLARRLMEEARVEARFIASADIVDLVAYLLDEVQREKAKLEILKERVIYLEYRMKVGEDSTTSSVDPKFWRGNGRGGPASNPHPFGVHGDDNDAPGGCIGIIPAKDNGLGPVYVKKSDFGPPYDDEESEP